MKYEDNEFDGLLNEALKEVSVEPRTGLEGRILARVRARADERPFTWWKWAAVAAMVILIVLGIAVRRGAKNDVVEVKPPTAVPEPTQHSAAPSIANSGASQASAVAVPPAHKHRIVPKIAPAQHVESAAVKMPFPAPTPLSEQEKALMLLARNNPEVLLQLQRDEPALTEKSAPIEIKPIKIEEIGEKEQ